MATNLLPVNSLTIRSSAGTSATRRRSFATSVAANSGKWWTPLFGMSSDADYIDGNSNSSVGGEASPENNIPAAAKQGEGRFNPGCFTEEKAKQLRMATKESFHDVMYHSAIASRLASDFSPRQ